MPVRYFRLMRQQVFGRVARGLKQVEVGFKIGKTQYLLAGLARAHEFAGAAQFQIFARDSEAVGIVLDDAQALATAVR